MNHAASGDDGFKWGYHPTSGIPLPTMPRFSCLEDQVDFILDCCYGVDIAPELHAADRANSADGAKQISSKEVRSRLAAQGITAERNAGKWVVTFPASDKGAAKTYRYSGSLIDVAVKIGVVTSAEASNGKQSDGRYSEGWVAHIAASKNESIRFKGGWESPCLVSFHNRCQAAGESYTLLNVYANGVTGFGTRITSSFGTRDN